MRIIYRSISRRIFLLPLKICEMKKYRREFFQIGLLIRKRFKNVAEYLRKQGNKLRMPYHLEVLYYHSNFRKDE